MRHHRDAVLRLRARMRETDVPTLSLPGAASILLFGAIWAATWILLP